MRHYEIVLLVHPDQSAQVSTMLKRYEALITKNGGKIHRQEDWGRRSLSYPIKNVHKAHFVLLNVEIDDATLKELTNSFRFNDAVIRNLVLHCQAAITEPSPMIKSKTDEENVEVVEEIEVITEPVETVEENVATREE